MGTRKGHVFRPLNERLDEKIIPEPNSGCWIWTGAVAGGGYGVVWHDGRRQQAHRVLYERDAGPIPKGLHIDHLCRVRCCCNPAHLEPVTCSENLSRSPLMDRNSRKTHCPQGHEYTPDNVIPQKGGGRACKACKQAYDKRRLARIRHGR